MKNLIYNYFRYKKILAIFFRIIANYKNKLRFLLLSKTSTSGSTHLKHNLVESLDYINEVYNDYIHYGNLDQDEIRGKQILEIGPGDNFGVALKFIAKGAEKVTSLDRFYSKRDNIQQLNIYQALLKTFSPDEISDVEAAIEISDMTFKIKESKIQYLFGQGIEDFITPNNKFDLIISRAVLEHVQNPDKAFDNMDSFLKNGGKMLHKVDLRNHGIFSELSDNPLYFLTINSRIWALMSKHSGSPNRKRINYYEKKLKSLGYEYKIYVTHILNKKEILPHKIHISKGIDYDDKDLAFVVNIRPYLAKEFKRLSDHELIISGIFLVVKKNTNGEYFL